MKIIIEFDYKEFDEFWKQDKHKDRKMMDAFMEYLMILTIDNILSLKANRGFIMYATQEQADTWHDVLVDKLKEAHWHYKNNNYSLPYKFASSQVIL